MNKTDFFTAVSYSDNSKSTMLFLLEKATDYFYLGGKKAAKIALEFTKGSSKNVYLVDKISSLLTTALKVALYCTIIILAAKTILLIHKVQVDKTALRTFAATKIQSACRGYEARLALEKLRADKLEKKQQSAVVIQSACRGYEARLALEKLRAEKLEEKQKSVVVIQSACRGHEARLELKKLRVDKIEEQKSTAAKKIQDIWRNRVKAKKVERYTLSYVLFKKAKPYVDNPSSRQDLPRALSGKTPVYLPKELPIVLKQSGFQQSQKRFDQMKQGHELCERNGYENLVIPKARVYGNCILGDFIIESRLPIIMHDTKGQIGLYIENYERFTTAVKEFTDLFCQSDFTDITGGTDDPYAGLSRTPLGRYDNIALYLEEGQGKIGLIDLEGFKPTLKPEEPYFLKCREAIYLFPYHLNEILETVKKFDPQIENTRQTLEGIRDEVLKFFKFVYEDHLDFIKEKNITFKNPLKMEKVNAIKKENIKKAMIVAIRKEHESESGDYKNCLSEKPDEVIALFEKSFPKILDLTTAFLQKILKVNNKDIEKVVSSFGQLLSYRTLCFGSSSKWYQDLHKKVKSELKMMKIEKRLLKKDYFASKLIKGIFEELAKEREIAYYNPNFGDNNTQCLFC